LDRGKQKHDGTAYEMNKKVRLEREHIIGKTILRNKIARYIFE
jgi:ribosomal protein S17E